MVDAGAAPPAEPRGNGESPMSGDDDMVAEFEVHHGITLANSWPPVALLVRATLASRDEVKHALGSATSELDRDPTFGLLFHLTERVYEQLAGSICCLATKNAAAAEVAARVAMESAANVRYILAGERRSRALAWLRSYVATDGKQISKWEQLTPTLPPQEQSSHRAGLARRREVHSIRVDFLAAGVQAFEAVGPVDASAKWPTIADRFETIGEAMAYRTAYARLSSQTHADAEDTINYMLSSGAGDTMLRKMSEETVAFSGFLVHFAATFYLQSLAEVCRSFGVGVPEAVTTGCRTLGDEMVRLGAEWGW